MPRRFAALVVHAQPQAIAELVDLLSGPDLRIDTACSEAEASHKISTGSYSILIAAHKPPLLDGARLLEEAVRHQPDAFRILLASYASDAVDLERRPKIESPIVRFVGRPGERSRLAGVVGEGLKLLRLVAEQRELVARLSTEHHKLLRRERMLDVVVRERTEELEASYRKLKAANRQALFGLAEAIEAKDPYTNGHCGRVAAYSLVLAQECGYPAEGLETLEFGAFLHDIGKIGIRDNVLLKPGPLDEGEWEHMRSHPAKGAEIAAQIEMLKPMMPAVRNHHERWDGSGYPDGMRGEAIPLCARIVAIADAYDAMATDRPYKRALPLEDCEALLHKNAGTMYDPELVEMFCRHHVGALYREDYLTGFMPDDAAPDEELGPGDTDRLIADSIDEDEDSVDAEAPALGGG
ncbi:MAG TPA: HD domain-containing phosphohydrolase [Kofleriaceae bacterium]|nr:HD domain-containing phosphohydrolase [Kofleriaceae bacterium]